MNQENVTEGINHQIIEDKVDEILTKSKVSINSNKKKQIIDFVCINLPIIQESINKNIDIDQIETLDSRAEDDLKVQVTINEQWTRPDNEGNFSYKLRLEEGENGQEVTLTFDELVPIEDVEDVGQVTVDVGSLSLVGTRCGPDRHDLLLRLWAAYQKRYGSELLAAHARRFREEIRPEIRRLARTPRRRTAKVGRNEPCPCGSGKKYKRCCGR